MKHSSNSRVLCFLVIWLAFIEQFQVDFNYPAAFADAEVPTLTSKNDLPVLMPLDIFSDVILLAENSNQTTDDDYLMPKTVYIGVDSIAAPEEIPETAVLPEETGSADDAGEPAGATENKQSAGSAQQARVDESSEDINKPAIVVNQGDSMNIDSQNEWGWTRLMSAAIEGDLQKVNTLLEQGANPDIVGGDGRSPLMAASWNKHNAVVEALINAQADVNLKNRDGWTALSFAAWNGDSVIVKSLLGVSANKFIKTADGFTPLQLASQKGHLELAELLK